MKTISVVVPTYNEEENIPLIYARIKTIFETLPYRYEIIYIDNFSTDNSRVKIREICEGDKQVKAIFNAKNFGFVRSTYYGLIQSTGDCAVLLFADMQDPPEVMLEFIKKWEEGYKVVAGIKNKSKENPLLYGVRKAYYNFIAAISDVDHIAQFTGFGLYDKKFIEVLQSLNDPLPYLRGIVAELGFQRTEVYYEQVQREHGKTSFSFFKLYDVAMLGITSYSKILMRLATLFGFGLSIISSILALVTLIIKLVDWQYFSIGTAAIAIGVFFLGSVQLFFIGLLGEYIVNINTRVIHRPLVIEETRLNFEEENN